ncbi:type II secretion system F family protein [Mollicutes bacterium LVI A0078]|nr:type II secretion system F family protein [Mollicutes bacterium LVI A0075]WOO91277.1 type II secretion system F family protein [Mollicutes bacterium LVI A0078]
MQPNNKLENQLEILKMLGILVKLGFALSTALEIMSHKFELTTWIESLEAGNSFYQILNQNRFDKDVLLIFKIGLDSEQFDITIAKAISVLQSKIAKREELSELVKYPLMLIVIGILSLGFVNFFLLPQFEKILTELTVTSRATTALYSIFNLGPYVIVLLLIILIVCGLYVYKLDFDRQLKLFIKIKPLRSLYISIYNQVFVITLCNLLKTNLHLSTVIEVLSEQSENQLLAKEAKQISSGLIEGQFIADCITPVYYDQQLIEIIRVGEQNGMLIYYLESYSKIISTINQTRGKRIIFWIQPIFYSVFGIIILLLYAAIFIPMFSMMDSI